MKELSVNYKNMEWEECGGYPKGTQMKMLRYGEDTKTFLLKLPPGFNMQDHSHLATEQHFVLEGEYDSGGITYATGTYRYIPAHANHGPFISEKGAIVLVVYTCN